MSLKKSKTRKCHPRKLNCYKPFNDTVMEPVKFKYKFDQNYNPKYVNGAYGGISSMGEIIINFYLERTPLPEFQKEEIFLEDGVYKKKVVEVSPNDLEASSVRFIDTGVIFNITTAKSVHHWLGEQIKILEELSSLKKEENGNS